MEHINLGRLSAGAFTRELAGYVAALRREIEATVDGWPLDPAARRARTERARQDFRYFQAAHLPHYVTEAPSRTHEWLLAHLPPAIDAAAGCRIAVAAPRGEGKSTLVSLALVLWAALTGRKHFILLLSDTADQAAVLLAAVRAELEANPRLSADFPEAVRPGPVWRADTLVTAAGVRIQALGSGQKVRGLRHGPHRPDLVIGDDLENDAHVQTVEQRRALSRWWRRAVRYAGPANGSHDIVVIGTLLHYDSLLANLRASPHWAGETFRAIANWPDRMDLWDELTAVAASDGPAAARAFHAHRRREMDAGAKVSWPAARPLIDLMLARAEDPDDFAAEQQNEPSAGPDALFAGIVTTWSELPADLVTFGAVDPSLGRAGRGRDPSAILVGGVERLGRGRRPLYILEAAIRRRPPEAIISDVVALQARYRCHLWAVEAVQFQEYFRQVLVDASSEAGVQVPARPVTPHIDKRLRIESLQPHVANKLILVHANHTTLIEQLTHYPHAAHDDGPDALEMLWTLASAHGRRSAGEHGIRSRPRPDREPIAWEAYG